jgi:hypothetical protein
MSYPCAGATGPLNWSHHDKLVCVDRETVFLGGLDLGFGRYDTPAHALTDRCHLHCTWPGKDYYNPAVTPLRMFMLRLGSLCTPEALVLGNVSLVYWLILQLLATRSTVILVFVAASLVVCAALPIPGASAMARRLFVQLFTNTWCQCHGADGYMLCCNGYTQRMFRGHLTTC